MEPVTLPGPMLEAWEASLVASVELVVVVVHIRVPMTGAGLMNACRLALKAMERLHLQHRCCSIALVSMRSQCTLRASLADFAFVPVGHRNVHGKNSQQMVLDCWQRPEVPVQHPLHCVAMVVTGADGSGMGVCDAVAVAVDVDVAVPVAVSVAGDAGKLPSA